MHSSVSAQLQPRLRLLQAGKKSFGPGKAELLSFIAATGSIRTAASELGMSYPRAWNLVREMNASFREPLVTVARGGGSGGGASLTTTGEAVLARYRHMEEACRAAIEPDWRELQALLRK